MRWSDIPFHPNTRTLRQFAVLWVCFFLGMAGWQWFRHDNRTAAAVLAAISAVGLWGCWRPGDLRPVFVGWMVLAFPIGWAVSLVMMAVLFYVIFTPLGFLFRLSGRDFLRLRRDPGADTYWEPMALNTDPKSYFNQF
jgi:Saxitoxin biosynthesis operon protein SxtJ